MPSRHIVMVLPFGMRPKGTGRGRALPLGQALVARGHRVTLLVPPWDDPGAAGAVTEEGGVRVRQLPLPPVPLRVPGLTVRLVRRAVREAPDVLHTFKPKAYSGVVALAWRALQRLGRVRAPLVLDTDDWEGWGGWNDHAPYSLPQKWLFAWQEAWGLQHADGVTVASRALEALALSRGVPPAHLVYAPNGSGAPWPTPEPRAVAALRARLGLDESPVALLYTRFFEFDVARLARRWAAVVAQRPDARLLVVGKGLDGEERSFHAALRALGVESSVMDVGWQPFATLPAHFALARAMLYPMDDTLLNRTKCPLKLADALHVGLPVVGEAVGQVREYLAPGEGGLLVPPGDDEAFVAATIALLDDPARAAALGRAGQQRLSTHFAWPVQAERVERLYERLLAARDE